MPSPFAARDAKVSGAIDRAFGEQFSFAARMMAADDVDLPPVADPSRPGFTVVGVWDGPAKAEFPRARGSQADDSARRAIAGYPSVSVDDSLLPWSPAPGCRVTRLFDGSVYEISSALPDGMGRTIFFLTARK